MLREKEIPSSDTKRDGEGKRVGQAPHPSHPRTLPEPTLASGKSVAEALRLRRTVREIGDQRLDEQVLSNLLFAACGVNRRAGPFGVPGLTAASASNSQEIDVYVALAEGAYVFDVLCHELVPIVSQDIRRLARGPHQPLISPDAPVELVYVANISKLENSAGFDEPGLHDPEVQKSYYFVDTGIIAANVYLFAASEGLACWFHNCDRIGLANALKLRHRQRALFAQTLGYPARGAEGA
jgi:hypothetical protein